MTGYLLFVDETPHMRVEIIYALISDGWSVIVRDPGELTSDYRCYELVVVVSDGETRCSETFDVLYRINPQLKTVPALIFGEPCDGDFFHVERREATAWLRPPVQQGPVVHMVRRLLGNDRGTSWL